MASRTVDQPAYRFGFNGQERFDDVSGDGNTNTAEHWEYDTRIAYRWNIDPVDDESISDYAVFNGNPILYTDPYGDKPEGCCLDMLQSAYEGTVDRISSAVTGIGNTVAHPINTVVNTFKAVGTDISNGDLAGAYFKLNPAIAYVADNIGRTVNFDQALISGDYNTAANLVGQNLGDATVALAFEGGGRTVGAMSKTKPAINNATSAETAPANNSRVFEVGQYKDLKGAEKGLDAHHSGQSAKMKQLIPEYTHNSGPAILVPKQGHTSGSGVLAKYGNFANARQLLARDILELRRVYPNIPVASLIKLVKLNKDMFPNAFKKN